MFDLDMKDMMFGQQKEAHGKTWVVVRYIRDGFYLAADSEAEFPAEIKLIKVEDEYKKAMEIRKQAEEESKT
jgi:hypothetical protein